MPVRIKAALGVLGSVGVTLLSLLALTFMIGRLLPLDPVLAVVGESASRETYDMVRAQMGLDQPIPLQFLRFAGEMVQGHFGNAVISGHPVLEDIARVFPATVELASMGMLIGVVLGVPLGVLAALHAGSWIDHVARVLGLIGHSAPGFWLGLMGLVIFYAWLGWVEGPGRLDEAFSDTVDPVTGSLLIDAVLAGEGEVLGNAFAHILLPASILGIGAMASISRMTRGFLLAQLSQEYIITARAKGLGFWRVLWRHALANIAVQLITVIVLSYAFLLEGAVLTETVFAWPGFGRYFTNSLLTGDMNAVIACTLLVGVVFITLNLLCDLLYRLLDPRIA